MQNIFIKTFFIRSFFLITMLVLFTCIGSGLSFLLMDTLFSFFSYPSFPITTSNPLYILFPGIFACFSLPCVVIFSQQSQFKVKKRFFLLLESHAFFFMIQTLFWALFCYFTLYHAENILRFLLGYKQEVDTSLTAIFMPLITVNLLPILAMLFLWISVKTSLYILHDEEKQQVSSHKKIEKETKGKAENTANFTFTVDTSSTDKKETEKHTVQNFTFTKEISRQIATGFFIQEWGNIFLLLCMLTMFLPFTFAKFIPALSTHPIIFLFVFLQYYLVQLYKNKKRTCLLLLGIITQITIFCFSQYHENFIYRTVFLCYFVSQCCSFFYFYRYGKDFFNKN